MKNGKNLSIHFEEMLNFLFKNYWNLLFCFLIVLTSKQVLFSHELPNYTNSTLFKKNITKLFINLNLEAEINFEKLSSLACSYDYGKIFAPSILNYKKTKEIWIRAKFNFDEEGVLEIRSRLISKVCAFHYSESKKEFVVLPLYPYDWIQKLAFRYYHISIPKMDEPLNLYLFINQDVSQDYSIWLYSSKKFFDEQRIRNFFFGIYYGFILIFLVFSLLLFFTTFDLSQLYYFFLVIGLVSTDAYFSGNLKLLLDEFITTNALFDRSLLVVTQMFILLLLNEILRNFLHEKKFNFFIRNFIIIILIALPITIFIPEKIFLPSFYFTSLVIIFLVFWIFIQAIISKEVISIIIMLSFVFLITTSFINILVVLHIFPSSLFMQDHIKIGILALIFVHSFLLSYKTYVSQKKLLESNYVLEERIQERTIELTKTIEELKEKDSHFQSQLNLASELQQSLFPNQSQTYPLIQFRIFQKGVFQVVGDFFDVIAHKNGAISFFIADASGHGISAALITTLCKITIRDAVLKIPEPKDALKEINQRLTNVLKTHNYITLFLFTLSPDGQLKYANAGHNSVFLYRRKSRKLETITSRGSFLGIQIKEVYFEQKETKIQKGDRILLYTDGFTYSIKRKKLSQAIENVKAIFLNNQNEDLKVSFEKIIHEWNSKNLEKKEDDVTFVMIEYTGIP